MDSVWVKLLEQSPLAFVLAIAAFLLWKRDERRYSEQKEIHQDLIKRSRELSNTIEQLHLQNTANTGELHNRIQDILKEVLPLTRELIAAIEKPKKP